jgi:hypothetical protein
VNWRAFLGVALFWCALAGASAAPLPRLQVSADGHRLEREDGSTFFWLGDTAWRLVIKSRRENGPDQPAVARYFERRAAQGFNVLQTALGSSLTNPRNAYGHEPFVDGDFTRPAIAAGPANDFWDYVDEVLGLAARHGIYVALLPWWGDAIPDGHALMQDLRVAYRYGHWLGARYRDQTHIFWVLGGDTKPERNESHPARVRMWRAMAEGLADGTNGVDAFDGRADWGTTLISYHPGGGGRSSADYLHDEPWLDFNLIQTTTAFAFDNWRTVTASFLREPPKPVLDSEVAYEESLSLDPAERAARPGARTTAWDARRAAYWDVFAGGFGHTYGHRSFIGWMRRDEKGGNGADNPWFDRLDAAGATQMIHLRRLIESLPSPARVPDQTVILKAPGEGTAHNQAMRAADRSYALIYSPEGRPFSLKLAALRGPRLATAWFDPRTGMRQPAVPAGVAAGPGAPEQKFVPSGTPGPDNDWVLVLLPEQA